MSQQPAAKPIVLHPCAKLNLTLEVLGRRPDGYHDLASVFQAIDLRDRLEIRPTDGGLSLECSRPDLSGEGNLALRAAALLRAESGVARGARLQLTKGIPVAAGLGGGSADAAAALVGLARLWGLDWPRERLAALAARLGSDVPFFLGSPTALAGGRGEQLVPLPPLAPHWALVARPRFERQLPPDKTRRLYAALRPSDFGDGSATARLVLSVVSLSAGAPLDPALLVNSFERPAAEVFPEIAAVRARLLALGAPWAHLAGSGPCLYALFPEAEAERAREVAERLQGAAEVYLARTLTEEPLSTEPRAR